MMVVGEDHDIPIVGSAHYGVVGGLSDVAPPLSSAAKS